MGERRTGLHRLDAQLDHRTYAPSLGAHSQEAAITDLYGYFRVPSAKADCTWLVELLESVGGADELSAASAIVGAVATGERLMALTRSEGDATLAVLENPPAGLEDLRWALARDQRDRLKDRE